MTMQVDAARLPDHTWNKPAPLWMGQLVMVVIEAAGLLLLLASYFYTRMQFTHWPPPGLGRKS